MDKHKELEELQKANNHLRHNIEQEVSGSTMDLINELIENELQQESLCGE